TMEVLAFHVRTASCPPEGVSWLWRSRPLEPMPPWCEVHKAPMITRTAAESIVIGTMQLERGNRITDSTLGQGVSKTTLVGEQYTIGFAMPIRVLSRKARIPVSPDIRLSLRPTFVTVVTVAGSGSFFNNLVLPRPPL